MDAQTHPAVRAVTGIRANISLHVILSRRLPEAKDLARSFARLDDERRRLIHTATGASVGL